MKKIQKEIVKKTYVEVFIANDGTEFTNESECRKYDESALGVLYAKYAPKVVKKSNEDEMFGFGCEDNPVEIVRVETQKDADLILQILFAENSWYTNEDHTERREKAAATVNSAIGDFLIVGRGFDYDTFYIYGSRKSIIEDLNSKFEKF